MKPFLYMMKMLSPIFKLRYHKFFKIKIHSMINKKRVYLIRIFYDLIWFVIWKIGLTRVVIRNQIKILNHSNAF